MPNAPDFNPEEQDLHRLLRPRAEACPPIDVLMAYGQEVLPPAAEERVALHLQQCPLCVALLRDLESLPPADLTPAQNERIVAKIPMRSTGRGWKQPAAIAAAILLAVMAGAAIYLHARPAETVAHTPQPAAVTVSRLELPLTPLAPPDDSALSTTRGAHRGDDPSVSELMPAFIAYNAKDYGAAAEHFATLAKSYPKSELVLLYLGVSQLLADRNPEAQQSLEAARKLGSARLADAADWYAAIAAQRVNSPEAKKLLAGLCSRPASKYSAESCRIGASLP